MKSSKIVLGLLITVALALCLMTASPVAAQQQATSLAVYLSVDPDVTYPDGTLHYTVTLINNNVAGARNCSANTTFLPPGPTGELDAYGTPVVLDTNKFVAVGETVVYNYTGGGSAIAKPVLAVDLGAIPLDEGVTEVYAAVAFTVGYIAPVPYGDSGNATALATVIERTPPVGGAAFPVDKVGLLAPWAVLLGCVGAAMLLVVRKRRQA